jgi:hypothetical protein
MVDKERGIILREQGKTYQEIAETLGCSMQWCKTNLKNVPKNTKELDLVKKCIVLAQRPEGMSTLELRYCLVEYYPEHQDEDGLTEDGLRLYKKVKNKVREKEGTVIRPVWLIPSNVDSIFKAVIQAVDNIDRRVDEEIQDIMKLVSPESKDRGYVYKSLENQLFNLSHLGRYFSKKDIGSVISALEVTIVELRKRVPQVSIEDKRIEVFDVDDETEKQIY